MVPIMNALKPDGMAAHWEFAYGPEHFRKLAGELSYPMIAINIYVCRTEDLFFPPYSVREIDGLRIGLVGIASNIVDKTMPLSFSEGVRFTLGLRAYVKIENPAGHRTQKVFAGTEEVRPSGVYQAAFVTEQGVASNYGRSRENHSEHAVDAMKKYLAAHQPMRAELRGTFIPV